MVPMKPVLFIIHGGWHVPESYSKLTTALRSAGYEVHLPRLHTTNQSRPPNANLESDTQLVRHEVEKFVEAGKNVIAIMHSYGGPIGTNALTGLSFESRSKKNLPGGVSHLIYVAAFALLEGESMMDVVKKFGHEHLIPLAFDIADDFTCVSRDPKTLLVGPSDVDEAEVDAYVGSLVRWNGKAMYENISHCAWKEIPVAYIHCTSDMTVPLDYQKWTVERMRQMGREVQTLQIETGHCPNLTKPNEMVDAINVVVNGQA